MLSRIFEVRAIVSQTFGKTCFNGATSTRLGASNYCILTIHLEASNEGQVAGAKVRIQMIGRTTKDTVSKSSEQQSARDNGSRCLHGASFAPGSFIDCTGENRRLLSSPGEHTRAVTSVPGETVDRQFTPEFGAPSQPLLAADASNISVTQAASTA